MNEVKVSIGIPTYNRPDGLKRTLERITRQTYQNLEIIISDNCSPGDETELIVASLMKIDRRIRYIKQEVNKGLIYNFQFVLTQATSEYFMWATDDDYFESDDLLEKLMRHAPINILTFSNYNFISEKVIAHNFFTPYYQTCKTRLDYIQAFCSNGAGHPSCGIYNLALLSKAGINLKIQNDLSYHMEGMLLHKIFDTGKVKYIDDALINYNTYSRASSSVIANKRIADFMIYTKRVLLFYAFTAKHSLNQRVNLFKTTTRLHYNYYTSELKGKKIKPHKVSLMLFLFKSMISRN